MGHGGFECMMIGINLLACLLFKDKLIEIGALKENITLFICLMSNLERSFAFILQVSLSVIIYKAIKENKIFFYFLAIIIHDIIDLLPLLKLLGILSSIALIEFIVGFYSLCISLFAYKLYNSLDAVDYNKERLKEDEKEELSNF
jgi:uncharacterized membrane protein YhfC